MMLQTFRHKRRASTLKSGQQSFTSRRVPFKSMSQIRDWGKADWHFRAAVSILVQGPQMSKRLSLASLVKLQAWNDNSQLLIAPWRFASANKGLIISRLNLALSALNISALKMLLERSLRMRKTTLKMRIQIIITAISVKLMFTLCASADSPRLPFTRSATSFAAWMSLRIISCLSLRATSRESLLDWMQSSETSRL